MKRAAVLSILVVGGLWGALLYEYPWKGSLTSAKPETVAAGRPARAAAGPEIRILLHADSVAAATVEVTGPYEIHPIGEPPPANPNGGNASGTWRTFAKGSVMTPQQVKPYSSGFEFGPKRIASTRLEIEPLEPGSLRVDDGRYRGRLRLIRRPEGGMDTINVLGLEEYVAAVLDSQMTEDFPPAAREAEGIVARSYALYHMRTAGAESDFDVTDDRRNLLYRGFEYRGATGWQAAATADSERLVEETRGLVLSSNGRLVCGYHTAVCGGWTTPASLLFRGASPALVGVECHWCSSAPNARWTAELDRQRLAERLGGGPEIIQNIAPVRAAAPAAWAEFRIRSDRGSRTINAFDLRQRLGRTALKSYVFTLQDRGGPSVRALGQGWGQGVGLCQWGARAMAEKGHDAMQIIHYYFPRTEFAQAY